MASRTNFDTGTVVLSATEAREIARLLRILDGQQGTPAKLASATSADREAPSQPSRMELLLRARALFAERTRRAEFFNRSIFGEPAWDMLLALYTLDGQRMTVGRLVNVIGAPQTTALRWLDYLEKERFVARRPDPDDLRVSCIELQDHGRELLDRYFARFPAVLPDFP